MVLNFSQATQLAAAAMPPRQPFASGFSILAQPHDDMQVPHSNGKTGKRGTCERFVDNSGGHLALHARSRERFENVDDQPEYATCRRKPKTSSQI